MGRKPREKPAEVSRFDQLAAVSDQFKGWQPGRDVLTPVRSVRTIFPQFNVATRVRGYPLQRAVLIHGPSNHGKTIMQLGLGRSFLLAGHFYFHVDAEMTTPEPWVQENLGLMADNPAFMAIRPTSYEETTQAVRDAAYKLKALREDGSIPDDTSALFGIDSLQKLVPRDYMAKLLKSSKEDKDVDPLKGRGGMFLAALNTAWMRELVPLLYHCNAGIAIIGRESQNTEAAGMFDKDYKLTGGNAVYYDSSLVCRIQRDPKGGWVKRGEGEDSEIFGERHRIQITKTKVGHKDAKVTNCYFHTSNGKLIPPGFDTARDVIEMAVKAGIIEHQGAVYTDKDTGETYTKKGIHEAVLYLSAPENARTLQDLTDRAEQQAQPEETDDLAC